MNFTLIDFILSPFAIFFILYISTLYKNNHIARNPSFKYFIPGLIAKLIGGIGLCFVYTYYYRGGDTHQYFNDGVAMVNLLFKNPAFFFDILINDMDSHLQKYSYFDNNTGYPAYAKDPPTFLVVRLTCLLVLLSFKSFVVTTILLAWISYFGVWRLYQVFVSEFPAIDKQMAIAFLFIPSVFFWGSGILKDTITLASIGFYVYSFYKAFIKRESLITHGITIFISALIIISIKPYILFALLPGSVLWIGGSLVEKFKGSFVKFFVGPILFGSCIGAGYLVLIGLSDQLGHYRVESILERAVVVQHDLKQDYYYGNSFDIGDFEPNLQSILSKAPLAISAALFRPFLWEVNNLVMFLSGLENMMMLLLTCFLIIKVRLFKFIKLMFSHNLLLFSLIFSLFFAFSVGLATANFGSLVRYKIPLMPFYVASLFIIRHYDKQLSIKRTEEHGNSKNIAVMEYNKRIN